MAEKPVLIDAEPQVDLERTALEIQVDMVHFFSNLLESVHESWLRLMPYELVARSSHSYSARCQASAFLASCLQMPPVKNVAVTEDLSWIKLDRFKLAGLARYVGACALRKWVKRIVAREEVAKLRAVFEHRTLKEVLESPAEIVQSGSIEEVAERVKNAEALLQLASVVGWDCMRAAAGSLTGPESSTLWRLRLSCPMEIWNRPQAWDASYDNASALALMNQWSETEFWP